MKLYHFNPTSYGDEYFIMSTSKEMAISYLNVYLTNEYEKEKKEFPLWDKKLHLWGNKKYKDYTIDVYGENQLIKSKIA